MLGLIMLVFCYYFPSFPVMYFETSPLPILYAFEANYFIFYSVFILEKN